MYAQAGRREHRRQQAWRRNARPYCAVLHTRGCQGPQQVHDADMHHVYLPKLEILLLLVKEGGEIHGGASVLMRGAPSSCGLWRGVVGGAYTGHNAWQIGACFS